MKTHYLIAALFAVASISYSCSGEKTPPTADASTDNAVIQTIMARRSIRDYQPDAIPRENMDIILKCGINAPNGSNMQRWEVRVVDDKALIDEMTVAFKSTVTDERMASMTADPSFKNMFRNAPTVVFIAAAEGGEVDCGLMGENMILAAQSMGYGSCCLGGPIGFFSTDTGAQYLRKLNFSEGYKLLYAIGFGTPAESPDAKPRDESKVKYVD